MKKHKRIMNLTQETVMTQAFELMKLGIELSSAEQELKAMYEQGGIEYPGIKEQVDTILALRERFSELEAIHIKELEEKCINTQGNISPISMGIAGGLPQ